MGIAMMHIVFRADASVSLGTGHVMRCLVLADMLSHQNIRLHFISRSMPNPLRELLKSKNISLYLTGDEIEFDWQSDAELFINYVGNIPEKPILIVDHYCLDSKWEKAVRPYVNKIIIIDDLANRMHDCDYLLDQNYYRNAQNRYSELVPNHAKLWLGPAYSLLREQFREESQYASIRNSIQRVLVTYGGSDPTGETEKVLLAAQNGCFAHVKFDIVVGGSYSEPDKIRIICEKMHNVNYHFNVTNMAKLMVQADVALGAGGSTQWERCRLGLPTILTVVADNQRECAEELHKAGVVKNLGWHENVTPDKIKLAFLDLMKSSELLRSMSKSSFNIACTNQPDNVHPLVKEIQKLCSSKKGWKHHFNKRGEL
ncbi:UDP-2,4-diacetamido-2,4,6-trideoxy-beta-L-altropyranose hydrolase [Paenibacillus melissococcoides]|uniref:UDP-2,4-diacetamido-2,4,6-trideoxy-beta-L-altropy ranose hydrolase n=1 Tax=Paenibacillus melissococcoides TaxID=2912268 RepID=A0ABM9GCE5_9BACL|nr:MULTISPECIES: UDP-2,4-diacetamido-2,4,6-trideoxy-beta-L-altropyranose hydrolase [Paenibacillus]MEB9894633.1 UDP-2,4-diacetamido-2,4,6-trideoxy-beta-L-altropyranose hydrolase [Bacillus cereus]CAH8248895.1 UDP-2,4-diacetamido-2,4,6-trideoxy-beta-L-altropyranose hydrolase [Paenibacillus melissococcoides]CAH8720717.1 UDP-2,4-diacetamido-2,4,6-trideoxy-beta-L-altropyranose hydrolase [Paenibacillus melissococcoides]CAH8720925.1 UDP-2,4-diacetamido-2,4,6-trideoxy-beta-L-altropyranose hydrolase [Pae